MDKRSGSADRWREHLGCLMHCVHLVNFMVGKVTQRLKICFGVKFIKNTLQVYSSETEAKLNAALYYRKKKVVSRTLRNAVKCIEAQVVNENK